MLLKPDYNLKRLFDINLEELKSQGVKAMLFDLDSTLMASKSGMYSDEVLAWLENVRKDFFVGVVSNNKNEEYIEKVRQISDFPLLFKAAKPDTCAISECVLVGDRPLTDILCGKNFGCKTILVDSITCDTESKLVRFVRCLERLSIRK